MSPYPSYEQLMSADSGPLKDLLVQAIAALSTTDRFAANTPEEIYYIVVANAKAVSVGRVE